MEIANPIYDVVFKYLMEDKKSAILLLSRIIGDTITELEFLPQEYSFELKNRSLTVYRIDFSAKIKVGESDYEKVIIEIQKAKLSTDIMRFRRYIGQQYSSKENTFISENGKRKALPIKSVYFLGNRLEYIKSPVVKVERNYYDACTGEKLEKKEEFIESLTHDSFVIQIPELKEPYKSELEKLLSIFNQTYKTSDGHKLDMNETQYPKEYKRLFRRLLKAASEPEIRKAMDIEDDILEDFGEMERSIAKKDKALEQKDKALDQKNKALDQKDKALDQKDKVLEQKDEALEQKDKALDQKDEALEQKDKALEQKDKALEGKDKIIEDLIKKIGSTK